MLGEGNIHDRVYYNFLDNMFDGIAKIKIILDENSIPIDFVFHKVNEKFINIIEVRKENIIGTSGNELLKRIRNKDDDFITHYNSIALNGGMEKFEEYWEGIDKWFSIFIYSDEDGYFTLALIDITNTKRTWNKINKISNILIRYIQLPLGILDYDIICKDILDLSEGEIVLLNIYNKDTNTFKIKSVGGLDKEIQIFNSIIGHRLVEKNISINKRINKMLKEDRMIKFYTLEELFVHLTSEEKIQDIKDKLNVDYCCSIVVKEGKSILGEIIILMKKNKSIFDSSSMGIYSSYLSSFLMKKNLEKELKEKEERWKFAIETNGDGIWDWNIKTNKVFFSQTWLNMLGYKEDELQKDFQTFIRLIPTEDLHLFYENLQKHFSGESEAFKVEHKLTCKNGVKREFMATGKIVGWDNNGNPTRMVCTHRDITEKKKAFEKVAYLCFHDSLTGLYNRVFLEEEMRRLDTKRQLPLTIIMGDLDCLKLVNDAFGHDEGDKLIRNIAKILKACCREEDIIARTGGDEFVILLPMVTEKRGLEIVKKIKSMCNYEMGLPIKPNISLGVATKINDENIFDVFRKAEERMYNNKLLDSKNLKKKIINYLTKTLDEKSEISDKERTLTKELCLRMAKFLNLSNEEIETLMTLSLLYDVGLIAIPKNLLHKEGSLSGIEKEMIKRHCEIGYRIASSVPDLVHISEYILCHHEYYNGKGYPQGLKGEEIPLLSRIILVLETYIKSKDKEMALKEIKLNSGKKFDPKAVDALEAVLNDLSHI